MAASVLTDVARIRSAGTPSPDDIANVGAGLQQQIYSLAKIIAVLQSQISSTSGGSGSTSSYFTITPSAGIAVIDLVNGLNQRLVLSASAVTILAPIFTGSTIAAGMYFTLYVDQDATGARDAPNFTAGSSGDFSSEPNNWTIDATPSTRTVYVFVFQSADSLWHFTQTPLDTQSVNS